jgi:hypothetical protein
MSAVGTKVAFHISAHFGTKGGKLQATDHSVFKKPE